MMHGLIQHVGLSGRRLLRAPGFVLAVIVTLSLGSGVNMAIFALVNGVIFKPVPAPLGDRLVGVVSTDDGVIGPGAVSWSMLQRLQTSDVRTLVGVTWTRQTRTVLSAAGRTRVVLAEAVAGNYFQLLGISPRLGRILGQSDDGPGASAAVVVSERLWRSQFRGSATVIGQSVRLSGLSLSVVGVIPDTFHGLVYPNLLGVDVWLARTAATAILPGRGGGTASKHPPGLVFGRLQPGVTFRQADAEVRVVSARGDPTDAAAGAALVTAARAVVPPQFHGAGTLAGSALLGLSGLVLFVACANLTSLWMTRIHQRAGELALRLVVGGDPRAVGRTLATEAAIVTAVGGLVGAWLATQASRVMTTLVPPEMGGFVIRPDLTPDWRVLVYVAAVASLTAVAITLFVAARAARVNPMRVLGIGGEGGGSTRRDARARTWIVAGQLAASVIVILAATLFLRSFSIAHAYMPGFETTHTAIAQLDLTLHGVDEVQGRSLQAGVLRAAAERAPGVSAAALASGLPIRDSGAWVFVRSDVQQVGLLSRGIGCRALSVSPGFFRTLGLPLRQGRDFTVADVAGARAVAIVSEGLAEALWPRQAALGRRLRLREGGVDGGVLEVVGVVPDTDPSSPQPDRRRGLYLPLDQRYSPRVALLVRGVGPGVALLQPLRAAVGQAVPDIALHDVRSLTEHVTLAAVGLRLAAIGLSGMGGLALLISGVGLYGLMAYVVASRVREFGIRRALGANSWHLYVLVVKDGMRMLALGVGPGVAGAWLLAGLVRHFLVGVSPRDWVTFTVAPMALVALGLVATLGPARRASRVEPTVALRNL